MSEQLRCPNCGHELSMFNEPEPDRAEQLAIRVADSVASWRFAAGLAAVVVAWFVVNLVGRFDPYPMVMLSGATVIVGVLSAFYGPLILLSQRRALQRDRARDVETYVVSANTEADLHRLLARLDALDNRVAAMEIDSSDPVGE
jgi:uncharacterized membrane protein